VGQRKFELQTGAKTRKHGSFTALHCIAISLTNDSLFELPCSPMSGD
jgi:hypothetical protein